MTPEIWKRIKGWRHEVSNLGRVRSMPKFTGHRWGGRRAIKGKILNQHPNEWGYLRVGLCKDYRSQKKTVHALVLKAFRKRPCGDFEARHLDGDKTNNRLSNLEWGTPKQNAADRARHGKTSKGVKHSRAVIKALRRIGR